MTGPTTTLDPRFSDPDAIATSWEETRRAMEMAELFWISSVRADGRPHVTPLVAVWVDDALHFCTGEGEQKAHNLEHNPHVILTSGTNAWDSGLDVVIEGDAANVTDPAVLKRLAEAWSAKWDGRWTYELGDGCFHHPGGEERILVFSVAPAKILAFAKGTFSQSRHRF
jgi:general stress protein 26